MPAIQVPKLVLPALKGEFRPPSDPERRTHTLHDLIDAIFEKGEDSPATDGESGFRFYSPTWTHNQVTSTVGYRLVEHAPQLTSLALFGSGVKLYLALEQLPQVADRPSITIQESGRFAATLTVDAGYSQQTNKQHITGAAVRFFAKQPTR